MVFDTEPKILVVDDEPWLRDILTRKLHQEGYYCAEAGDASEAMEKLISDNTDLVILDIMMPGKSGRELLPEIRSVNPDTGIIMATAVAEPHIIIECMKNGADDYITKPFDLPQVVHSVSKVINTKHVEQRIKRYQSELEKTVEEQKSEIRKMFLNSIESLISALEAKDEYTGGHSRRVTSLAIKIGQNLGLSANDLEDLRWGALLHDVGKIAIDPAIQNKVEKLTPEEYQCIMTHSVLGAGIVKPVATKMMVDIISHHHDRFDGKGYGQSTPSSDIPLGAKIVAVADSVDAMTSNRPYRPKMASDQAIAEVIKCSGSQFDPIVVDAFLKVIDSQPNEPTTDESGSNRYLFNKS